MIKAVDRSVSHRRRCSSRGSLKPRYPSGVLHYPWSYREGTSSQAELVFGIRRIFSVPLDFVTR